MMAEINEYLLGALENILGKGHKTARGNFQFHCPFCNHRKPKLEVRMWTDEKGENPWNCWVCGTKGRTIRSLLKHLNIPREEALEVLRFVQKGEEEKYLKPTEQIRLPDEYQPLMLAPLDSFEANRFKQYLYKRGLTDNDFIRYDIGYCVKGPYAGRVIIPSYDANNRLNYFVARSINFDEFLKYKNPKISRDVIVPFENRTNWNESITLCEGVFDSLSIRRNCVPLLGKRISSALMKKIIENPVPEIYILLDADALKDALVHCETFLNMGKKVYLVRPTSKDPGEEGFEAITKQLQSAKELTFKDLLSYKLESI